MWRKPKNLIQANVKENAVKIKIEYKFFLKKQIFKIGLTLKSLAYFVFYIIFGSPDLNIKYENKYFLQFSKKQDHRNYLGNYLIHFIIAKDNFLKLPATSA